MAASQPGPVQFEPPATPGARSGPTVTFAIIGANVIMFVLMSLASRSFVQPSIATLLRWGADYRPLTLHGQWWRMFTSMFVHIGVMHLVFNMYVLLNIWVLFCYWARCQLCPSRMISPQPSNISPALKTRRSSSTTLPSTSGKTERSPMSSS